MFRTTLIVFAAALLLGAASPIFAEESFPADVQVVEVPEAPITLQLVDAVWQQQDDGSYALAIAYSVDNQGENALASVGWSLAVETEDGTPKRMLDTVAAGDLEAGDSSEFTLLVHETDLGGFEVTDRISLAGRASSSRRCGGPPVDCAQLHFACEMSCNNPLGTDRGVEEFTCGPCGWYYDSQQDCWYQSCQFTCRCGDLIWPDQMPALDIFFDWDPWIEEGPTGPWPPLF